MRSGRDQARPHQVVSLCDLSGGHEAKAKAKKKVSKPNKVVPLGMHHTILHPDLQWERDQLLTKLWRTQDQMESWHDINRYSFQRHTKRAFTTGSHYHHEKMMGLFKDYITSLKNQLLSLDERISPLHDGR